MIRRITLGMIAIWLAYGATAASASLLRYDVHYQPGSAQEAPEFYGFMVFSDVGPVPGNIWPNIVDWEFDVNGFIVDPTNTVAWADGYFAVDASNNYLIDYTITGQGGLRAIFPCFTTSGDCDSFEGEPVVVSTLSALAAAIVVYPGFNPSATPDFSGTLTYSDPTTIPLPSTFALVLSLCGLLLSRRRALIS